MISDTLSDAIYEIHGYLTEEAFAGVYVGDRRKRIEALVSEMEAMRRELDTVPSSD